MSAMGQEDDKPPQGPSGAPLLPAGPSPAFQGSWEGVTCTCPRMKESMVYPPYLRPESCSRGHFRASNTRSIIWPRGHTVLPSCCFYHSLCPLKLQRPRDMSDLCLPASHPALVRRSGRSQLGGESVGPRPQPAQLPSPQPMSGLPPGPGSQQGSLTPSHAEGVAGFGTLAPWSM